METNPSKRKVIDAAISLFFQNGFHGTSVRDIAEKATVNVSLISYYFKGKQGLLEYAVTEYYEQYLQTIEETIEENKGLPAIEQIKELADTIIQFKETHFQLSCMIHRELTLDTVFVREMIVTYLAKENYYIEHLLSKVLKDNKLSDKRFLNLQLKGMLITPFILHREWREYVISEQSHQLFIGNYVKQIHNWLDYLIEN